MEDTELTDVFFPCGEMPCRNCGTKKDATAFLKCGKCGAARYCNRECQEADWETSHKKMCTSMAVLRLQDAIDRNDAVTVQKLARIERVLNGRNKLWSLGAGSGLHKCVAAKKAEMMKILLAQDNCDVDIRDSDEETPLCFAASIRGSAHIMQLLLDSGADPDAPAEMFRNPILMAMHIGDVDNVRVLLEGGANLFSGQGLPVEEIMRNQLYGANIHYEEGESPKDLERILPRFKEMHEVLRAYIAEYASK
jgi:MYND finger/Ankyrin repeats (3 copies)